MPKDKPVHLTAFQKAYSAHIRSPSTVACPEGIPRRRSLVYQDLLFSNTKGFVEKCFPVSQSLFSKEQWLHLAQLFFKDWPCHTPYFSQIPLEFVHFIDTNPRVDELLLPKGLPPWLPSLLHYEWLELKVETSVQRVKKASTVLSDDNANKIVLVVNPTLVNAQYNWPVHQISINSIPSEPKPTYLLVYRCPDDSVQFMEVNAMTASLVTLFEQTPCSPATALTQLCELAPGLSLEQAYQFGLPLIIDLLQKHILLATED